MKGMKRIFQWLFLFTLSSFVFVPSVFAQSTVPLYGMFEQSAINASTYTNPFDFNEIELQTTFTAPSGKQTNFFGFYDGDGTGGQTGNVWKLRFMPDEVGTWSYTYDWSGSSPNKPVGGSGSFIVTDTGIPGPLKVDPNNPKWFIYENGDHFFFKGYYYADVFAAKDVLWQADLDTYFGRNSTYGFNVINTLFYQNPFTQTQGWNAIELAPDLTNFKPGGQYDGTFFPLKTVSSSSGDITVLDLKAWKRVDQVLQALAQHETIWYSFDGFVVNPQTSGTSFIRDQIADQTKREIMLKNYVARLAPYWNTTWNIAWEWHEPQFWNNDPTVPNLIGTYVKSIDPWNHVMTIHDRQPNGSSNWFDYYTHQYSAGTAGSAAVANGTIPKNLTMPAFAQEVCWEGPDDGKLTGEQVRPCMWGVAMAAGQGNYAEQFRDNGTFQYGDGGGFPYVKILNDFMDTTRWWNMQSHNELVNPGKFALADAGNEYIIYSESGSTITVDLTGTADTFFSSWLNPRTGAVTSNGSLSGGSVRTVTTPNTSDWVLYITKSPLYGLFETSVTNPNLYTNPFDFNEIELQATFTAPSGKQTNFFGFYDGDGNGGQTGNVWKLRFMPDEVGTWSYTYDWTGSSPNKPTGGSGSFSVVDTGLPGPLKVATDNSWYFEDARGNPFDWRGYDMHIMAAYSPSHSIVNDIDWYLNNIQTRAIDPGYNFIMGDGLIGRKKTEVNLWQESWWLNSTDTKRFNIPAWNAYEKGLKLAKDNKLYVINFAGMIYQGEQYAYSDFQVFLKYWVARFAPFYNFMGWSPTWEWTDIWSTDITMPDQIMQFVYDNDPWKRQMSIHDCSQSIFTGWLGFSMRQRQSRTIFAGNSRTNGQKQGACDGVGGIGAPFVNQPIIGSEDIWERTSGSYGQPQNAAEVRKAAWGIMMAGVMPLYSEWNGSPPSPNGTGEVEVQRMFDFFYSKTNYRQYQQLNSLVSSANQQIASGIPGQEYLVYDQDGGAITINLSGVSSGTQFDVLWFDPTNGTEQTQGTVTGGSSQTISSLFSADSVLLLTRTSGAITGDLNADNTVNIQDIIILINEIFNPSGLQGSDVTGDGKVDLLDVISLINIIFS